LPGKSLVPVFGQDGSVSRDYLWWLHEGSRAIRVGDYKLVAAAPSLRGRGPGAQDDQKPGAWELYDLKTDPAETTNLADRMPEKVRELAALWTQKQNEFFQQATADLGAK
jgi:arylsulfatase